MEYKVLDESYREQVEELWDYCFEKKDDPFFQYYFSEYAFKQNTIFGGVEQTPNGEKLRIMLHLNPYTLKLRGQEETVPYIVGVATAPEARGQHLFRPLLKATMEYLRTQGINFVTLMPINAGIYLPYEFAFCYYRHAYDMPLKALQKAVKNEEIAQIHVERKPFHATILGKIYDEVTEAYHGVPVRKEEDWKKLITVHEQEGVQCAVIYDKDENPCAYMLYSIAEDIFHVIEMMTSDVKYKNRFLQYAAQHESSASKLSWLADQDDMTYLNFADANMSGRMHPFMMARCVNIKAALENIGKVPEHLLKRSPIVLSFTDSVVKENNCTLKMYYNNDELRVEDTTESPCMTMSVAAFTQIYFGAFSVRELELNDKIQLLDAEKEMERADVDNMLFIHDAFSIKKNYINEYF